jgi:beta-lactamase class A
MVMAGTLLEAQSDDRPLTSFERSRLEPMITESANQPVRDLWNSFGGSPWFAQQTERFTLHQTNAVGDNESGWGRSTTSAADQVHLLRQVLVGDSGPLEEAYRNEAWDLMTSVVPSQTWGVTAGVPGGWVVAQKNGFAGHITNSVGFVQDPATSEGYLVAILTNGWRDWKAGVSTVEEISRWIASELAH